MGGFTFWMMALGLPSLALGVDFVVRLLWQQPHSAAANFVLLLMVFDTVVVLDIEHFSTFMAYDTFRSDATAIFALMWWLGVGMWLGCLAIERRGAGLRFGGGNRFLAYCALWAGSCVVGLFDIVLHTGAFLYRGGA